MERAEQQVVARRARRMLWVFRLVVPAYAGTNFDTPCAGASWRTSWRARDRRVPFRFNDGRLTVKSSWAARFDVPGWSGRHAVRLRAELDGCTMRLHGVIRQPDGSTYTRESGDVTFAAG